MQLRFLVLFSDKRNDGMPGEKSRAFLHFRARRKRLLSGDRRSRAGAASEASAPLPSLPGEVRRGAPGEAGAGSWYSAKSQYEIPRDRDPAALFPQVRVPGNQSCTWATIVALWRRSALDIAPLATRRPRLGCESRRTS